MSESKAIEEFKNHSESLATKDVASTQAMAEVQAAMVVAKRFPRDETSAYNAIMTACRRPSLAEQAMYSYPRGGQRVTGPSIRLAETMARHWGNIEFGTVELERRGGESSMMAFCWDKQTNTRVTKVFQVRHERKARGSIVSLDDARDIYELTANQGSRRVRACILAVIPGDIVDAAVEQCEQTLQGASKEPLIDRVRKVVVAFDSFGVTKGQIEKRFGHTLETLSEIEFVQLRKVFMSVRDGMSTPQQWFEPETTEALKASSDKPQDLDDLTEKMKAPSKEPTNEEMFEDEKANAAGKRSSGKKRNK